MKRILGILLIICMCLTGCGVEPQSVAAEPAVASTSSDHPGSDSEVVWDTMELDFTEMGYQTEGVPDFSGYDTISMDKGTFIGRSLTETTLTVSLLASDGTALKTAQIPVEESGTWARPQFCFDGDSLWAIKQTFPESEEATGVTYTLEHWSLEGELLLNLPLDESFPWQTSEPEEPTLSLELVDSQGLVYLNSEYCLYALDEGGNVVKTLDFQGCTYSLCQDGQGNLYLLDPFDAKQAYCLETDSFTLGQPAFPVEAAQTVIPGGGAYSLYLLESGSLMGVDLQSHTITTLVKWADLGLAGAIQGLVFLDENTYLVNTYDPVTALNQVLKVSAYSGTPPEKTPLRVAYVYDPTYFDDASAANMVDGGNVQVAMNRFNRENPAYQAEFCYYAGDTALQLALLSGDIPDLILFDSSMASASEQILSKKGYLTDLEPLFDSDETLSTEDFLPNVLSTLKESNGGLYTIPVYFYFRSLVADQSYVGDLDTWSTSQLYQIAQTLPEDMVAFDMEPGDSLQHLLEHSINQFVDVQNLSCNFTNDSFYDLLRLCRDYCSSDGRTGLIQVVASMGSCCNLAEAIADYGEDCAVLGYPDAPGNGGDLVMGDVLGIFAGSQHPDAAWQLLRSMFTYEFQDFTSGIMLSIRQDVFYADNRATLPYFQITQAEMEQAEKLVLGACSRTVYDSPVISIVLEEAQACFNGDRTPEETGALIENRVKIYLWEQCG